MTGLANTAEGRPPLNLTFRPATLADLDDIIRIVHAGYANEPMFEYLYSERHSYPEQHARGTRGKYQNYLNQPEKYSVHLIQGNSTTIAVAAWDFAVWTPDDSDDAESWCDDDREDRHFERFQAYESVLLRCKFFDELDYQLRLLTLVTLPEARGCSAARMLIDCAVQHGNRWPLTVLASPLSQSFFARLGFDTVAIEHVRAEGEEDMEPATIVAMELHHKDR